MRTRSAGRCVRQDSESTEKRPPPSGGAASSPDNRVTKSRPNQRACPFGRRCSMKLTPSSSLPAGRPLSRPGPDSVASLRGRPATTIFCAPRRPGRPVIRAVRASASRWAGPVAVRGRQDTGTREACRIGPAGPRRNALVRRPSECQHQPAEHPAHREKGIVYFGGISQEDS